MLEKFIGQDSAIAPLITQINAYKLVRMPMPHMLFLGTPGTGKTTLATLVAEELRMPWVIVHCPNVDDRNSITASVIKAQAGILFLEEVHALKRQFAEDLFTVIDSNQITQEVAVMEKQKTPVLVTYKDDTHEIEWGEKDIPTGRTETISTPLKPLTIIGATTDESRLPEAFLSRLSGLVVRLQPYDTEALKVIALRHAETMDHDLTPAAAWEIATRCRYNPRRLKQITERVIARAVALTQDDPIDMTQTSLAIDKLGIDEYGLEEPHRKMMKILTEPISRTGLAQKMGIPVRNVDMYFGELVNMGFATIDRKHTITIEGDKALDNQ